MDKQIRIFPRGWSIMGARYEVIITKRTSNAVVVGDELRICREIFAERFLYIFLGVLYILDFSLSFIL